METNRIYVPKRIRVGFQKREDTYTKKLAYVIYYDEKNELRKEKSWNTWRSKEIEPVEFDNVPTSGFVLNKKVGDYSGEWGNHRLAYCRVYDPRDFEFEITITTLLYILENCSSIKGKGLDGEFVYGWEGSELVLIPTASPDYKKIQQYADAVENHPLITGKMLKPGYTYTAKNGSEYIYLCRANNYDYCENYKDKGLKYYFAKKDARYDWDISYKIAYSVSVPKFISESETPSELYPIIMEDIDCYGFYSPLDETKNDYRLLDKEELYSRINQGDLYASKDGKAFEEIRLYGETWYDCTPKSYSVYFTRDSYHPRIHGDVYNNDQGYKFYKLYKYTAAGKPYKGNYYYVNAK